MANAIELPEGFVLDEQDVSPETQVPSVEATVSGPESEVPGNLPQGFIIDEQSSTIPMATSLPEISAAPEMNALTTEAFLALAGALFTFDDVETGNIINKQLGAEIVKDSDGELVAKMPSGEFYAINKPGISGQEVAKLIAGAVAFTPVGRVGTLMGQVIGAGAIQAGIEVGKSYVGGQINPMDVAIASAMPVAFKGLVEGGKGVYQGLKSFSNKLRTNRYLVDPNTALPTPVFQRALEDRGLSYGSLLDDVENLPVLRKQKSPSEVVDEIVKKKLKNGSKDDALYKYKLENGKIVDDQLGIEAERQGFLRGDISSAKSADPSTKQEMHKMLNMKRRIQASSSEALDYRPSDIVGDHAMSRFDYLRSRAGQLREELNRVAGQEFKIDPRAIEHASVGGRLKNLEVSTEGIQDSFFRGLDNLNINYTEGLPPALDFAQSLISEDKTSQKIIKSVVRLLSKDEPVDAYVAHMTKRQLDTMLDFNKQSIYGLTDAGKKFAKNIRHSINQSIRDVSPRYALINDEMSASIRAMEDLNNAVGGSIDVFGEGANKAIGTVLRRLLGNQQSRTNLDNALNQLDNTTRALGGNFDVDIKRLVSFNKTLDDRFGSTARGSFQGDIESALRSGPGEAMKEFAIKKGAEKIESLIGINDENAFDVMSRILRENI